MKHTDTLHKYWHTLSHLRPQQLGGQVWVRMRPWLRRLAPTPPEATGFPGTQPQRKHWRPAPPPSHPTSALRRGTFCFINEQRNIHWPPDWQAAGASKLWQYNLHYFEWLWQLELEEAISVVDDWIQDCHPPERHVAWEPYPTSLRLLNWYGVFFDKYGEALGTTHQAFRERLWKSCFQQLEWLSGHLEFHLMGNHLLENAATLALLGSRFKGPDATRWRSLGERLLRQEIPEQFPQDGLHFERSPMYHSRLLYLVLLLVEQGAPSLSSWLRRWLPRMSRALATLCHPDEDIALLNDSAFGIYHPPSLLLKWCQECLGEEPGNPLPFRPSGSWALPNAGYYGAHTEGGHALLCDAGAPGPDYIPGHAHADIFSFELSLKGHRVIVDSGVFDYLPSDKRRYCRSTRAHNTVEVEGQDQSEMWGAFRVARRGQPRQVQWHTDDEGFELSGWHDGYMRLSGTPTKHHRRFQWSHTGTLHISDRLTAPRSITATSRLHLHPSCDLLSITSRQVHIRTPGGRVQLDFHGAGELRCNQEASWYCPAFAQAIPNPVLAFVATGSTIHMGVSITT